MPATQCPQDIPVISSVTRSMFFASRNEIRFHYTPGPLPAGAAPVRLLIGMYGGPDGALLAPPLELPLLLPNE